jgi:hypothetical protein
MFGPLSAAYSKQLSLYLHNSQGLLHIKKRKLLCIVLNGLTEYIQEGHNSKVIQGYRYLSNESKCYPSTLSKTNF